ncbi:MAG: hypothetical protein WBR17_04065 [Paraburkholderia sp.]|uniref:hypothetical protein n=1 Tax=Paraburkholderia sp. TaxID=1926495 RepID=UPI003C54B34C
MMRERAALAANAEDADLWRWFSRLVEERRIRWCCSARGWLVSVDNRHVATAQSFDDAMRDAMERVTARSN